MHILTIFFQFVFLIVLVLSISNNCAKPPKSDYEKYEIHRASLFNRGTYIVILDSYLPNGEEDRKTVFWNGYFKINNGIVDWYCKFDDGKCDWIPSFVLLKHFQY